MSTIPELIDLSFRQLPILLFKSLHFWSL